MIKEWYNTNVDTVAAMLEVDDDYILKHSNGLVTHDDFADDKKEDDGHSLISPDIFGKLNFGEDVDKKENSLKMGHIKLACPIVNIQYFKGRKPILVKKLGLSIEEIERFLYYSDWIVTDPGKTEFAYKQIINEKEYKKAVEKYGDDFTALQGGSAIDELLEKEQVEERKYIVLHYIPVLPLSTRYYFVKESDSYGPMSIETAYSRILASNNRLLRVIELGAPYIALQHMCKTLQENVDRLIANGVRGYILKCEKSYEPIDSLDYMHECISCTTFKRPKWSCSLQIEDMLEPYKTYLNYTKSMDRSDAAMKKSDELAEQVEETFRPFVYAYIKEAHPRYIEFSDLIFKEIIGDIVATLGEWLYPIDHVEDKENEDFEVIHKELYLSEPSQIKDLLAKLKENLEKGIVKCVDLYIKKQLKWNI